jgi:hypothetical protein
MTSTNQLGAWIEQESTVLDPPIDDRRQRLCTAELRVNYVKA